MHIHIKTHTGAEFVFSHTHSDADVGGTIGTLQAGSSLFQLEEMEHMSQALFLSGPHTGSPLRFVDVSLAPSPLLVWWNPLSVNDSPLCLLSKKTLLLYVTLQWVLAVVMQNQWISLEIKSAKLWVITFFFSFKFLLRWPPPLLTPS